MGVNEGRASVRPVFPGSQPETGKSVEMSAPGTTRTCDLGIRRPLLYPPELRRQCAGQWPQRRPPIRLAAAARMKSVRTPGLSAMVGNLDTRTTPSRNRRLTATKRVPHVEG